ncbi:MAG: hypothetical protein CMJ26_06735 [Phycisphaerae bacterium]|nr:hypothetical protein [Phycisphaerae bacterium]
MYQEIAISMRAGGGNARDVLQSMCDSGVQRVQLDALHQDFAELSNSGWRDLASTLRRLGLRASGIDFLVPPSWWEEQPERTLQAFANAVAMSEAIGNVPIGTRFDETNEAAESAIAAGQQAGVLLSRHGTIPPEDPQVGWHLPLALLAKEQRPMKTLVEAPQGPMAIRLRGAIVGDSTLEFEGNQVELRELRGVLDAMRWNPTPILDCAADEASDLCSAWQVAGPW